MIFHLHGPQGRRHRAPHAPASSPLRRSNAAAAASAFRPVGGGHHVGATPGGAFARRPPNLTPRPAPQCSRSGWALQYAGNEGSPTSVAATDGTWPSSQGGHPASSPRTPRGPHGPYCGVIASVPSSRPRTPASHHGHGSPPGTTPKNYKREMCKNVLSIGWCRFGPNCTFAHSAEEQAHYSPSAEDVLKSGHWMRPCPLMTATGVCPYDQRCKSLHDPRTASYATTADAEATGLVVMEHNTKAKKHGDVVPDRLYHLNLCSIRQTNPLVAPFVWDPRVTGGDDGLEFEDTYNLVCNKGKNVVVLPTGKETSKLRSRPAGGGVSWVDVANKNILGQEALAEAQRLCVVLQMLSKDESRLDFVYAPRDCINGQPCMVLQTRYFHLRDLHHLQAPKVSVQDVAREISLDEFHRGKGVSPFDFIEASEVAFDSKGKETCNLSIWFDTTITTCSISKAKKLAKVSKEHEPWLVDSGALFTMPNNDEFRRSLDASSPPFVLMQPVDDLETGHALVKCILEHKVATLIRSLRLGYVGKNLTDSQLHDEYNRLKLDLETWAWPQTTNRDHGAKMHEVRNRTAYVPPERSIVAPLWASFAKNLNVGTESLEDDPIKERLPVFRGFDDKADADASKAGIPRLRSTSPTTVLDIAALCDATRAIEFEVERQRKNAARSTPVSPTSFSR